MANVVHFRPETPKIMEERLEALWLLFPEAFSEGKIDLEKFHLSLGDSIDERPERYSFSWASTPEAEPQAYVAQKALFNDPLGGEWDAKTVIAEVAPKVGYGLNMAWRVAGEVPQPDGTSAPIYQVSDPNRGQRFFITLADRVEVNPIRGIDFFADTLFICRDVALNNEGAANLAAV